MGIKCKIADLNVNVDVQCKKLATRAEKYAFDFRCEPDIKVIITQDQVKRYQQRYPEASLDTCAYLLSGSVFYRKLLGFDGFMIHSSAIEYDGKAYMFSAPCGTGKSTHTDYWVQKLGKEKVSIINDDKPAVRFMDGKFYCCGTPWSGKNDASSNIIVPVGALVFIERSEENYVRPVKPGEILKRFFPQTVRPSEPEAMSKLLDLFEKMVKEVPVYVLGAENDISAADFAIKNIVKKEGC
jgi:hypothetical protein